MITFIDNNVRPRSEGFRNRYVASEKEALSPIANTLKMMLILISKGIRLARLITLLQP
jgi:hypothetical protein